MIRLSPSSVARWYEDGCPARWNYGRTYRVKEEVDHLLIGTLTHSMLEGELDPQHIGKADKLRWTAKAVYEKLHVLRTNMKLNILHRELAETFPLKLTAKKRVEWSRRIDAIALDENGDLVVIDYKTTPGQGWKTIRQNGTLVAPKSLGLQSMGYLIPGERSLSDLGIGVKDPWPKKMYYLVGPYRGNTQVFGFDYSEEAYDNFIRLVGMMAAYVEACELSEYPKNYSHHCPKCPMMPVCFEQDDWGETLAEKEPRVEDVDET